MGDLAGYMSDKLRTAFDAAWAASEGPRVELRLVEALDGTTGTVAELERRAATHPKRECRMLAAALVEMMRRAQGALAALVLEALRRLAPVLWRASTTAAPPPPWTTTERTPRDLGPPGSTARATPYAPSAPPTGRWALAA